ncbi:MAG: hypothetical protein ABIA37_04090, partial [Candidatus Woesearchaeota archaeon]
MSAVNKRGALFHWLLFGVLAALGLFLILSAQVETGVKIKGEWQLNFLQGGFLAAEKELVSIDQQAKNAGWEAILELDWKGKCGEVQKYSFWNKEDNWGCVPDLETQIAALVKEKMSNHSEIKLEGKELIGKGETRRTNHSKPYYQYDYSTTFRVDLGIDLEGETKQIVTQAVELVGRCRNVNDLKNCTLENKPAAWKFKDCKADYTAEKRAVFFCVESAGKVYDGKG